MLYIDTSIYRHTKYTYTIYKYIDLYTVNPELKVYTYINPDLQAIRLNTG